MSIRVSIIIPTLNSDRYLKQCLESLVDQSLPNSQFEVLIADGGSTDQTKNIIKSYQNTLPLRVFANKAVDAESGKDIGLKNAKGDIICLLDSDNVVVGREWLVSALNIFDSHEEVWGVESPWFVDSNDTLINQYFTMLRIADPVARLFAPTNPSVARFKTYEIITFKEHNTPVTGANGFFWRKEFMKFKINETNKFEETNYVSFLVSRGHRRIGRLVDVGIIHYYCDSLRAYIQKRKKIANKFLQRKNINQETWVDKVGPTKLLLSAIYNISIIGPTIEAIIKIRKTRNIAWIYHPIVSLITVITYAHAVGRRFIVNAFNL